MDNQLIDTTLQQLLATPHEQRTPDRVIAVLSLAAEAAEGTLNAATPLEQELNTLQGALETMASEYGMQSTTFLQNWARQRSDIYGALIQGEKHYSSFGTTAADVLASIRQRMSSDEAVHA